MEAGQMLYKLEKADAKRKLRRRGGTVVLVALALGALLGISPAVSVAAKPLSKAKGLARVPAKAKAGASFKVAVKLINASKRKSAPGSVVLLLSKDAKPSSKDGRVGKRKFKSLKPRKKASIKVKAAIPKKTPAGRRKLIACVANKRDKLSRRPSCKTAGLKVTSGAKPGVDPARPIDKANPLSVSPALDSARAQAVTISAEGGTLAASAANGTTFTLTIPADALGAPTKITMTPLASVAGLPFDSLVGGVDLAPHGLRLYRPARLALEPATPVALSRQSPFLYQGAGQDFHSYPLVTDPSKLELELMHFTGAGVADGSAEQRAAQQGRAPGNIEAQLEQRMAQEIDDVRAGRSTDAELAATFAATMRRYHKLVVAPRLSAAESDDELAELAIHSFLAWARSLALLGMSGDFDAELDAGIASLQRILRNAYDQTFTRCIGGDVSQIHRLLGISRSAQLLGIPLPAFADIDRCVRFTLDYDLTISDVRDDGFWENSFLEIGAHDVPLRMTAAGHVEGPVPLEVFDFNRQYQGCYDNEPHDLEGGTATVTADGHARFEVVPGNPIEQRSADGRVRTTFEPPDVTGLSLDPGAIEARDACWGRSPGLSVSSPVRDPYVKGLEALFPEMRDGTGGFRFAPWTVTPAGDPWALFSMQRSVDEQRCCTVDFTWTGDLRFAVRHTPAG